jgi:peptidoglycan-associated lipoprotein
MSLRSIGLVVILMALGACSSVDDPLVEYSAEGGVGEFGTGTQHDIYANFAEALGTTDRVVFAFDSSVLDPRAQEIVALWADALLRYPELSVVVEGHCDERGSREYNLALGERRAEAVRAQLVALGIDPARIATISFGKERPLADGHDETAWAQNRRAVLTPG